MTFAADQKTESGLAQETTCDGVVVLPAENALAPTVWWRKRPALLGTVAAQFAMLALGLVSGLVSGRMLGPQGRGELAAITLWPMAFVFFASLGLNQAIVFYTGRRQHSISEVWTTASVLGVVQSLLVVVVGFLLMPVLLRHYPANVQRLGLLFLMTTPALLLGGLPGNVLQGAGDLLRFNIVRLISPACYTFGLLGLWALGRFSLQAVVATQVVGFVAAFAAGLVFLYRREHPAFVFRTDVGKKLLGYGLQTHLANLTSYLNQRVDQLILALLIPAQELGLYAMAVALAMSVSFFPAAAGLVTFSRGSGQSDAQARHTISRSFRASLIWLLAGCCGLFFAAPILITVLLGPRFAGSVLACRLLLPGMVALGLNQVLYSGANAMGKPSLPSYAEGVGLAVTIIGLVLLVPRYGYIGAAIVSSVAYTVSFVVMLGLSVAFMQLRLRDLVLPPRPVIADLPGVTSA